LTAPIEWRIFSPVLRRPFQAADKPLPAVVRALVAGLLFGGGNPTAHAHESPPFVGLSIQAMTV
jgi:hypothetical protein